MVQALSRPFIADCMRCIGVSLALLLVACSPKLDWRSVQSPQLHYIALFPAKPEKIERTLSYQDHEILQTLEAVKVDDDIYSVSTIHLTQDQMALMPAVLAQLQDHFFQSAGVKEPDALSAQSVYQTEGHERIAVTDYFLNFPATNADTRMMRVRWITRTAELHGAWIYQVSVLHTAAAHESVKPFLSSDAYSNFFDEFHPE